MNPLNWEPCSVEGRVTTTSGEPLAGVKVAAGQIYGDQQSAITDADGTYRIDGIRPGSQSIWAESPGYATRSGGRMFYSGGAARGVDFRLPKAASLSGRIADEEGRPLPGMCLALIYKTAKGEVMRVYARGGLEELVAKSDSDGRFQLDGVPPGRYFLFVSTNHPGMESLITATVSGVRRDGTPVALAGFYPHSAKLGDAQPFDLAEGQSITAVDFRLWKLLPHRIQGRIEVPDGVTVYNPRVVANPATVSVDLGGIKMGVVSSSMVSRLFSRSDRFPPLDTFDIWLLPGSYRLQARFTDIAGYWENSEAELRNPDGVDSDHEYRPHKGEFPIQVTDHDIEGLVLSFRNYPRLEGWVRFPGLPTIDRNTGAPKVTLVPAGPLSSGFTLPIAFRGSGVSGNAAAQGSFEVQYFTPGRYRITAAIGQETLTVDSVRYNGQTINGTEFEAHAGENGKLEVSVPYTFGDVTINLQTDDPQSLSRALMVLSKTFALNEGYVPLNPDGRGRFIAQNVPPGQYVVILVINDFLHPPIRKELANITVPANGHTSLDLKLPTP